MNLSSKIEAGRLTETQYRKLLVLSYSMLKTFDKSREDFYREYIICDKKQEKPSNAITLGNLVHTLLANQGDFDSKYHVCSCKPPVGQMLELADALYIRSLQSMNEFNEQQDNFKVLFSDAVQKVKYDYEGNEIAFKKKDEAKILEMFEESDCEMFYKEKLENFNKTIVTIPIIEQAERLVQKVKESDRTCKYTITPEGNVEVFTELPIQFTIAGIEYKCLPDRMEVDHDNKIITPIDWKTNYDNESCEIAILKYGYYLQMAMYDQGIKEWAIKHELKDYKVELMKFIFIDTKGFNLPVILTMSRDDLDRAHRGFKVRGIKYKGLDTICREIAWNFDTGMWGTSRELHESNGVMKLRLQYGTI